MIKLLLLWRWWLLHQFVFGFFFWLMLLLRSRGICHSDRCLFLSWWDHGCFSCNLILYSLALWWLLFFGKLFQKILVYEALLLLFLRLSRLARLNGMLRNLLPLHVVVDLGVYCVWSWRFCRLKLNIFLLVKDVLRELLCSVTFIILLF